MPFFTIQKCSTCDVVKTVLSLIFTFVMFLAIVGASAVFGSLSGPFFGSAEASLSTLALILTLMLWTMNLDCSRCPTPKLQNIIVATFLILATVVSLVNLYQAHFRPTGFIAGTVESSLSIVTFAVVSTYWAKHVESLCGSCKLRQE